MIVPTLVFVPSQSSVAPNWLLIIILIVIIVGVLLGPYELLLVIQRIWEQRRRERIARGEDVRPRKLPWDEDD
jgi:hypothetical protein